MTITEEIPDENTFRTVTDSKGNPLNIIRSDGAVIPIASDNCDYQKFLQAEESLKTYEVAYEYTFEGKLEVVKTQRNWKLEESDKYTFPDFPIDDAEREEWLAYRQHLRDLPSTITEENIDTFEWPARPDETAEGGI